MSSLTDRYVAATLRSVPRQQRPDIERELRASIADAVDARADNGESPDDAEFEVLTDLGAPAKLAANYSGRSLTLIGPEVYLPYLRTLKMLALSAIPITFVVVAIVSLAQGKDPIGAIFGAFGTCLTVAVYLGFFVTLAFVIADRNADSRREIALADGRWSPKMLPVETSVESHDYSWSQPIASLVGNVILVALIIIQRAVSPISTADGTPIPILDPSLWDFWIWYFFAIMGLAVVIDFVKLAVGRWRPWTALIDTLLGLAAAIPLAYLFWQAKIVNPALLSHIGHEDWAVAGNWLGTVIALFVLLLAISSIAQLWRNGRTRRAVAA